MSKRRFDFVHYNCATSVEMAISRANGFLIEDRKLFVKFAAFESHRIKLLQKRVGQDLTANSFGVKNTSENVSFGGFSNRDFEKKGPNCMSSYADVVKWKDLLSSKITIKAKKDTFGEGNNCLSRSVIARLPSLRSIESISDTFLSKGFLIYLNQWGVNMWCLLFLLLRI